MMLIDKHYHTALSAEQLINEPEIKKIADSIKSLVSLPDKHFTVFYLSSLKHFLSYMQYYHQDTVIQRLEMVIAALKLRRSYILPTGIPSENVNKAKDIWTYTVFLSTLMHKAHTFIDKEIAYKQNSITSTKKYLLSSPILTIHQYKIIKDFQAPCYITPMLLPYILDQHCIAWLSQNNDALDTVIKIISDAPEATQIDHIISACFNRMEKLAAPTKQDKVDDETEQPFTTKQTDQPHYMNHHFLEWLKINKNNLLDADLNKIRLETSAGIAFLIPDIFRFYAQQNKLDHHNIQRQFLDNKNNAQYIKTIMLPNTGQTKIILLNEQQNNKNDRGLVDNV